MCVLCRLLAYVLQYTTYLLLCEYYSIVVCNSMHHTSVEYVICNDQKLCWWMNFLLSILSYKVHLLLYITEIVW